MEIKLVALSDITLQNGYFRQDEIKKGDIIEGSFGKYGVRLLLGDVWSLHVDYEHIKNNFKVYGQ